MVENIIEGIGLRGKRGSEGRKSRGKKSWTHDDAALKVEEFQKLQWRR